MALLEPEYAIRSLLIANVSVAALIGTRMYPMFDVPENAKRPYICFHHSGDDHVYHMAGESGLIVADVELSIFSTTDSLTRILADVVRRAIAGYTGAVTVGSNSTTVQMLHIKSIFDGTDPAPDGGTTPIYQKVMNIKIGYTVPLGT